MNAAFQPGLAHIRTAFVLAAPGSEEEQKGHPAAGVTGQNLNRILAHLHTHDSTEFPSTDRFDYRITNSVGRIMSGPKSMPDWIDVVGDSNLERLHSQIHEYGIIVALSQPALIAVELTGLRPKYYHLNHPARRGMNGLVRGRGGTRAEVQARVDERYRRYACQLLASKNIPYEQALIRWPDLCLHSGNLTKPDERTVAVGRR